MRKVYHPKIRFYAGEIKGHFLKNLWQNDRCILFHKKTHVLERANQIIQRKRNVYIKVSYEQKFFNDGIYQTEKDLKDALAAFTENKLLNFALSK